MDFLRITPIPSSSTHRRSLTASLNAEWCALVDDPAVARELAREPIAGHHELAGLPAPRCNSALVYVNGEFYGVYANVEAEDKTFLSRWFASNDGNLYEEGQVDFVPGAEVEFDLETNETANDRTDLMQLIAAVDSASDATFLLRVAHAHWRSGDAAAAKEAVRRVLDKDPHNATGLELARRLK